ncbi:MAG TPA: xyloglucanase, partial [Polyangiaceae bacterium]
IDGGGVWATDDLTAADSDLPTHWAFHSKNLEETAVRDLVSPPEGPPLLSVMADLCGFRHDRLDASPERGKFDNPPCASADDIDFAGKKPSVVVRVGNHPWDGTKPIRGALSTDAGNSWKAFGSEPAGSGGLGSVGISADGASLVWAARETRAAYSRDGGTTWTPSAGLPEPRKNPDWAPWFLRIAADGVNPKKFYAFDSLEGIVYASTDGGAHFAVASRALSSVPDYELTSASIHAVPGFEGHVWVTTKKELAQSTDSGTTFRTMPSVEEAYAVGFGRAAPGQKYPAIYLSGKVSGVVGFFRSDDAGASFARINDDAHQYAGSFVITGDPRVYGRVYLGPPGRGIVYGEPR